jgi:hypothetical protein
MKGHWKSTATNRWFQTALAVSLSVLLILGAMIVGGCDEKKVSLEYKPSPDTVIVKVESDGGLPYPGDDLYPRFQLFGDGRVIEYQTDSNSRGILVQGKLGEEDIANLLKQVADTGFFDLKDEYQDRTIYDATYREITLGLLDMEKSVRVWMMSDVPKFDAAYDLIMNYPLGEVSEYVPDKGYLVVVKYSSEAAGGQNFLDPNSDIYKLLPDAATLTQASGSHTAVAVDGATFMQLKKYDNQQKSRGLYISQPDGYLVVYPVYEPRTAQKP